MNDSGISENQNVFAGGIMTGSALLRDNAPAREERAPEASRSAPKNVTVTRPSKETLRLRLYLVLAAVDSVGLFAAFAFANLLWVGEPLHAHGMDLFVLALPLFLGLALNSRAYSIDVLNQPRLGMQRASRALILAVALVIGAIFYLKVSANFSRMVMALGTIGALASISSARWLIGRYIGRRMGWSFTNELLFVDQVPVLPTRGEIVIFADKEELSPTTDNPLLLDRIGRLLKNCDRVVLACPPERRAAWAAMMKGIDVSVEILSPELDHMGALDMGRYGERSTLLVSRGPLGLRDRAMKRAFDLALTVPALVLLLPLFGAIALAIKLDSKGPVFFRQPRMGQGSRIFNVLKFRTMHVEASDRGGAVSTRRDDSRVTLVGKFLRATSLDELPQLFNVLMDDMSIVGPRPHALGSTAEDDLFWEIEDRYWERHVVKPGITGLAQVRGFRGATFQRSDLTNRLQADLEYLSGWSIWRDIGIVAATLKVLKHKNAF